MTLSSAGFLPGVTSQSLTVSGAQVRTGWSTALSRVVGALLLFEIISGLAITFGPFHPAIEWGLLLHTMVGLVTVAPLALYLMWHWSDYTDQALSDVLLLGYVGLGSLAICIASGLLVTGQAMFGIKTSAALRYVHLVSTLLALAATVPHMFIAWLRRYGTGFARGAAGWAGVAAGTTVAGVCLVVQLTVLYSGTKYRNEFPSDYSTPFGKNRPFAPSLAHTSTNGAFDPRSLAGSAACGASGCHTEIYDEWKTSAHRYAAMDPIFQGIKNVMAKQNGHESTRYCGGCHDPISLFSGSKNLFTEKLTGSLGYDEGISCLACHSIQKTDIQGNANYTIWQPGEYLWQWSPKGTLGAVARNFLIRAWPAEHNRLSKRKYKKPENLAAWH